MIAAFLLMAAPDCALCHKAQAQGHSATPMARTLAKPAARPAPLRFASSGLTYTIDRNGTSYSVADATGRLSAKLVWAVGFGSVGQTYLFEREGDWYESAVSFYPAIKALDWTPGHADRTRRNLGEALGRRLDAAEAGRCFGCHSTTVQPLQPGVQCARCHEGSGHPPSALARLSQLGPEDLNAVCSKCHPSWAEVAETGPRGVGNVRHHVYRLTGSKCYDSADRRIGCAACHDVHRHEAKPTAFFDTRCGACHQACRAGNKSECISCHMPKVEIPGLHARFTDHRIRVVRPGGKYPD